MPGDITDLINDLPDGLTDDTTDVADATDDEEIEDQDETEEEDDQEEEDSEEEDDPADGKGAKDEDEDDEDLDVDLGDEEEEKPAVETPAGAPKSAATDEGQFILDNLPKIKTSILIAGADGKDTVKEVEVYGWGQLLNIPGYNGFATKRDEGAFINNAQSNETKATQLQTQFRSDKIKSDTKAYTTRENRSIAKDLRALRQEGIFPKFKGVPGSASFNSSDGAKEFDRVVQFMNEQNDEAGKAANAGEAFYHMSFRMAYRILHPDQFDEKAIKKQKDTAKKIARRVKTGGGGSKPEKNVAPRRVTNITDLAEDFANFVGTSK